MLCALYKTEKDNIKVYEMLMNNFEEAKYANAADKNAMVLLSRK